MGMYPDLYGFSEFADMGGLEDVFLVFAAVYLIVALFGSIYSIVVYVLHSLGMYTIAKRRGIHNPWLAWIPVANLWALGSISDQYQYVAKGKVRNRRKVLLGLTIAMYVLLIVLMVSAVIVIVAAAGGAMSDAVVAELIAPMLILLLSYLAMLVIAIILLVYEYIAYYDLFTSCNPNNATAFLVLGIFFTFLLPFFVFACRKKDLGMPQPAVQPEITQCIPAPVSVEPEVVPAEAEPEEVVLESSDPVAEDKDFETEA